MSYCLHCGAPPGESHLRICPDSANPSQYVIADPAPVAPPRRHLSPIATGTQDGLQRIAAIRAELHGTAASEKAPVASADAAEGDRSSGGSAALTGLPDASDDVGGWADAI